LNLIVYLRDKEFYLYHSEEKKIQSVFETEQDVLDFFTENKVTSLSLIFSRPLVFVRTLEFPFSGLKKISQVLPEESASLFPVPAEELELFWYPVSREKTKTTILILGVERKRIERWQKLKSSFKFSMRIGLEPFVLTNYVSKTISERNYLLVFIDENYIAKYRVENSVIVESSSSFLEPGMLDEYLEETRSEKSNLPVILLGEPVSGKRGADFRVISQKKSDSCVSMLFALFESFPNLPLNPAFKIFNVRYSEIAVSPVLIFAVCVYLGIAGIMFRPYFVARHYQEKVNSINRQMEELFRASFPDVSRVVNPVIQARENLKNSQGIQQIVPKISVISIMSTISKIVPENIPFKISQMSLRGRDLFLNCLTDTLENVEIISQCFRETELFSGVKVGGIMPESGQITFNLLIKIENVQN